MLTQYVLFGAVCLIGIILVFSLEHEAFQATNKKNPSSYARGVFLWAVLAAFMLHDYLRPSGGSTLNSTLLIVIMTIGLFLLIGHTGFLIAMWRTRQGQQYFSVPGVLPRMIYIGVGFLALLGSWWYITV